MKTDQCAREVQEQVDGEEVLDPDNTSSVWSTVLNKINNEFQHECLEEAVRLLNVDSIHQSTHDCVPGQRYSIPGLPRTKFLAPQFGVIWFIVMRSVWDADIQGALVMDLMGLKQHFHLGCSGNALQIGNWESCNRVGTVHLMGE